MQDFHLVDYIKQISELYRIIRQTGPEQPPAFILFKETRDNLLKHHAHSILTQEQKIMFMNKQLCYYDYNQHYRVKSLFIENEKSEQFPFQVLGECGMLELIEIGHVQFKILGRDGKLAVFLIRGYGSGIFIPFKDKTNALTTSRYGKYLYDTLRGADLGWTSSGVQEKVTLLLDFNYSYHPNCYYNDMCKSLLLPEMNTLDFKVEAGEKLTPFFTLNSPTLVSPTSRDVSSSISTPTHSISISMPSTSSFSSTSTPTSPVAQLGAIRGLNINNDEPHNINDPTAIQGEPCSLSSSSSLMVEIL